MGNHNSIKLILPTAWAVLLLGAAVGGGGCQQSEDNFNPGTPTTPIGTGGDGTGGDGVGGPGDNDAGAGTDDAAPTDDASGSGGPVANPGTGGAPAIDAPVAMDAAPGTGGAPEMDAAPVMDAPPSTPPPRMPECKTPSIDHLAHWYVASEAKAVTVPGAGSILVPQDGYQVGKVSFVGAGWHIVAVWVANSVTAQADLSNSASFTLTYSATADLWVQLREVANYEAGGHFVAVLPSTGGQLKTISVPLTADHWMTLPSLGKPTVMFADAIKQVRGLFFIDDAANTLEFDRLVFDNFTPACM